MLSDLNKTIEKKKNRSFLASVGCLYYLSSYLNVCVCVPVECISAFRCMCSWLCVFIAFHSSAVLQTLWNTFTFTQPLLHSACQPHPPIQGSSTHLLSDWPSIKTPHCQIALHFQHLLACFLVADLSWIPVITSAFCPQPQVVLLPSWFQFTCFCGCVDFYPPYIPASAANRIKVFTICTCVTSVL